jgi:hypothetical protein
VLTLELHDAIGATSVDRSLKSDELMAKLMGKYVMKIYDVTIYTINSEQTCINFLSQAKDIYVCVLALPRLAQPCLGKI